MRRAILWILQLAVFGWLLPGSSVQAGDEGWIPFDGSSGAVLFRATVNGHPAGVVLDSGASIGAVSRAFAERVGIEADPRSQIQVVGVHDQGRVYGSREFTLMLNEAPVRLRNFAIVPGAGFDILLGRWIFERAVVQIDYPNQRVRFLNRDGVNFEGNVPMRVTNTGEMLVDMSLDGRQARLLLDTGNTGMIVLTQSFVRRHGFQQQAIDELVVPTQGVIASADMQLLQLNSAQLGPYPMEGVLAGFNPNRNEGLDGRERTIGTRVRQPRTSNDGLLGYEVMRHFIVTIDWRGRKLHLQAP